MFGILSVIVQVNPRIDKMENALYSNILEKGLNKIKHAYMHKNEVYPGSLMVNLMLTRPQISSF